MSFGIVKRSHGQSATAGAAYISGTTIRDTRTGKTHCYDRKSGVLHHEVMLPLGSPDGFRDRSVLWNAAEHAEHRKDSQVARTAILSLPKEFTPEQRLELTRRYVREFVGEGMAAMFAIHAPHKKGMSPDNHHAHVLLSMRQLGRDGFYRTKTTAWNSKSWLQDKRALWAAHLNEMARVYGHHLDFDHRSKADRGDPRKSAHLALALYHRTVAGRQVRHGPSVIRYQRALEHNLRHSSFGVDRRRAEIIRQQQEYRRLLRELTLGGTVANRAALDLKKRRLKQRADDLRCLYQHLRTARSLEIVIAELLQGLFALEQRAQSDLERWERTRRHGITFAAIEHLRRQVVAERRALKDERGAFAHAMDRERQRRIDALRQMGRYEEAFALDQNAEMFRLGDVSLRDEAGRFIQKLEARARLDRARDDDAARIQRDIK